MFGVFKFRFWSVKREKGLSLFHFPRVFSFLFLPIDRRSIGVYILEKREVSSNFLIALEREFRKVKPFFSSNIKPLFRSMLVGKKGEREKDREKKEESVSFFLFSDLKMKGALLFVRFTGLVPFFLLT